MPSSNYFKENSGQSAQPSSHEANLTDNKLYIAGLLQDIDEKGLQEHFSTFGCIIDVLIMKDRNGQFK
jgi:RNA recognition motif-containing protein